MQSHLLRTPRRAFAISLLLVLAGGCGGGGGSGENPVTSNGSCAEPARKQFVLDAARSWYLFDDLLPTAVDVASFTDAEALLDHLTATAREQGKDRYFSYLTTRTAESALLDNGQFVGFGFRTRIDPVDRPMISEVFESSPAAEAGLQRGDEIIAVDAGTGFVPVANLLADGSTISDALGPAEAGVRRGLRLLQGSSVREVSMVKRTVTIDPVPDTYGVKVLPQAGTPGVGYVNLRSYVSTADAQLAAAFAQFRSLGLRDFIVDLRYNGGGLLSTAELLNDLLGGARSSGDVQLRTIHNTRRSAENDTRFFRPNGQSVQPVRVAFLTTGATASASEIDVNSQLPWLEVAIVGEDTLGKPVGQYAFDLQGCDDRLRLVAFKTVNALDQGDYYDGLAGSVKFACAATDDLGQPIGAVTDELVTAALQWLGTGACGTVMTPLATRSKVAGPVAPGPQATPPPATPAQRWLPGVE